MASPLPRRSFVAACHRGAALLAAAFAFVACAARPETAAGDAPVSAGPNIVFLLADDHSSQALGCYGGRLAAFARTPHIDRLAAEGALLENLFCTNSICVPSRASILTGQYSHRNHVRTLRDGLARSADNVAKRLQTAGYQTAVVGKWHLKYAPSGFDYWNVFAGQGRYRDPVLFEMRLARGTVHHGYSSDVVTDLALAWLRRRAPATPFCLMLHFKAAHEPWQYPARQAALYRDVELPEPSTLQGGTGPRGSRVPGWPLEILTERMTTRDHYGGGKLVLSKDADAPARRRATYQKLAKDYLRCIATVDENVGRVLAYLESEGLAENTIVVYTSDQGYFLGEHNYFDKRFMLEESLRMPCVVRFPREIAAGTRIDAMVLNVDFAPTLLDYAGAERPGTLQGRSFRGLLAGRPAPDWRQEMYYRYYENSQRRPAHFGIRTRTEKLIYYDGLSDVPEAERWEFYDLARDPAEAENVAGEPAYAARVVDLKERLARRQHLLGDRP